MCRKISSHAVVVIVIINDTCVRWSVLILLDSLIGLCKLSQRSKGVWAKLVEDTRNELGELLDLASAINRESVCGNSRVYCMGPGISKIRIKLVKACVKDKTIDRDT